MAVYGRLLRVPEFDAAPLVFTYVSAKDSEVDTHAIIADLLANGIRVACPKPVEGARMEWREIRSVGDLAPGKYGIPEPGASCKLAVPDVATVALVPGLLFDGNGHRLGYGGGYFDRFLAHFPGISIGLAYDFQVASSLPSESHDVPLHFVVTETRIYGQK